ncbi:MAG: cytidylate kinase-like family protein [Oscillospiraceae bacterium]|nr:cytidylate kinase-like family protein [Oscillospiraceae bacterium]
MNKIITIGRQFGSGGRDIGKLVAEKLGFAFYDRDLISIAAEKSGMSKAVLTEADEKAASPWVYAAIGQSGQTNFLPTNDTLFAVQSQIILDIAKTENAVIVGRCADYILREAPVELLNVYLYASDAARVKRVSERLGITEQQALQKMKRHDKQRKLYYDFYTDRKWAAHVNYHLTLDSEKFGDEGTAAIIAAAMNAKRT